MMKKKCEIMEISTHPDNVVPEREWISRAYIKKSRRQALNLP